jgi:hypothetical protein
MRQGESRILLIFINEIKIFRKSALAQFMLLNLYPASASMGGEHGRAKLLWGEEAKSPISGKIAS